MKIFKLVSITLIVTAVVLFACNKESANKTKEMQSVNASQTSDLTLTACDKFTYSDTIFYLNPRISNYIVKPVAAQAGIYGAYPDGLSITASNGYINVSKSETGMRYIVWFIPSGTSDTCKKFITISGVNYNNIVYVMANSNGQASPVYNANASAPLVCNGCAFDNDSNGRQDLAPQGFVINKTTGVIDFKKSIQNGVFGKTPVSGTKKEFTLYYRLGDKSGKALNHISFEMFYYTKQSDIPKNVMEDLLTKQSEILLENAGGNDDEGGGGHGGGGHGSNVVSMNSTAVTLSKGGNKAVTKCRPPYIIVTQQ